MIHYFILRLGFFMWQSRNIPPNQICEEKGKKVFLIPSSPKISIYSFHFSTEERDTDRLNNEIQI